MQAGTRAWRGCSCGIPHSAHAQQLYFEHQRRVRWDHASGATRAVAQRGWDGELALAAHLHARRAFVPALDDSARAQGKHEAIVAVLARIELGAVGKPAGIVHLDLLSGGSDRAIARDDVLDDESGGTGGRRHGYPF